ncbi:bifunctional diguanylate cyclase/phosphodiesterase [Vreelandella alkaliphila]|uniref:EAL domain-containing protein n=1 Tax=Vreelandella alkaliphila TaxID=272774 RepID=A0A7C9JXP5_9GAMM|nr:EAL domain-containing protein [Halomonas alkaliphila]NDL70746.1 EAL domain-containing protein [Halomonas alkaliphila]
MTALSPPKTQRRLSLTWRVIALSSLLLLLLVALFIWLGQHHLTQQLESSRVESHERQQREIRLAMQRSADNLRQLAGLTAAAPELGSALQNSSRNELAEVLSAQWPSLQLEAGVDEVFVFNAQGVRVGYSGISESVAHLPIQGWIGDVLSTESPITALRCAVTCQQFAAVPVLMEGVSIGMVVLSRSLADVTRQAREVSGSEIALMVTGPIAEQTTAEVPRLDGWNGYILALTNRDKMLPLLTLSSSNTRLHQLIDIPFSLEFAGRHFELSAVYMEEDADWRSTGYFLIISDITAQIAAIQSATQTLLIVGITGWLAAELLMLVILLGPMARLRRVADLLPALSRGEFSRVRDKLPVNHPHFSDEIDVLEDSTRELSQQLETLEIVVQEHSGQLAERVDELAKERDFVNSLLDTARVFIVVQNSAGRIQLINDYTRERLGLRDADLIGRHFSDLFDQNADFPSSSDSRHEHDQEADTPNDLVQHLGAPSQEEKTFQTQDKRLFTVAWFHAPLANSHDLNASKISVGLDITERKAAESRLTWLAEHDPLTELYNRHYFQDALQRAIIGQAKGAVLLLDLDQFKEINELSGHYVGDRLLREVANTLFLNLSQRSIIARLGGDEFALLLENITSEQAINVAEYISQLLDGIGFTAAGRKHHVSASIGIALFPINGQTPADLLASADMAMYKAKESSSQHWYLLRQTENAKDELQERVYWVERLHKALENDEFELWAQPIVRLKDRDIKHYEVLLRMRNDDGSLVPPAQFIPVAEQSGLIVQVDRWVIRHSLEVLTALQKKGMSLAVNLSGQSLHDLSLKQYLANQLKISGADPYHLILEVTETAAITDFTTARNVLQAVRELGCRTALDDFGIGFSSFHYLSQLPVDYIKIDGSFIRSLLIDADSHTLVKAIADIANGFGKQTIAEFVDQEALVPVLLSYGIQYGQGFHLGKPEKIRLH